MAYEVRKTKRSFNYNELGVISGNSGLLAYCPALSDYGVFLMRMGKAAGKLLEGLDDDIKVVQASVYEMKDGEIVKESGQPKLKKGKTKADAKAAFKKLMEEKFEMDVWLIDASKIDTNKGDMGKSSGEKPVPYYECYMNLLDLIILTEEDYKEACK